MSGFVKLILFGSWATVSVSDRTVLYSDKVRCSVGWLVGWLLITHEAIRWLIHELCTWHLKLPDCRATPRGIPVIKVRKCNNLWIPWIKCLAVQPTILHAASVIIIWCICMNCMLGRVLYRLWCIHSSHTARQECVTFFCFLWVKNNLAA